MKHLNTYNENLEFTSLKDIELKNQWLRDIMEILDEKYDSEYYYDAALWMINRDYTISLEKTMGYAILGYTENGYYQGDSVEILKTTWKDSIDDFIIDVDKYLKSNEFNI